MIADATEALSTKVADASSLLGLLLVLITLFTSEQSRILDVERHREGGPRRRTATRVAVLSGFLAVVTIAAILLLSGLAWRARILCCHASDPLPALFELIWLLLPPLAVWQVALFVGAARLR